MDARDALLALTPDEPRWVEARALLRAGAPVVPAGAGYVVLGAAHDLLVAIGDVDAAAVIDVAAHQPGLTLLCAIERGDVAAAARAARWGVGRALLHTLPDPDALPSDEGAAPLPADADLGHLPAPLAAEIDHARAAGVVWTVYVDGAPVTFAYAPWRTERWFDVSVDTLPEARQLGLATRAAAAMIRAEGADGRAPVWGAVETNQASRRLAARLGFVEADALWLIEIP